MPRYDIYVRDAQNNRLGLVDDYKSLKLNRVFNDVGTWQLEMHGDAPQAANMAEWLAGIEVWDNELEKVVFSGYSVERKRKRTLNDNIVEITGEEDLGFIRERWAHASPTEEYPPYTVQANDVRTGPAGNVIRDFVRVNIVAGSAVASRVRPGITVAPATGLGSSVTGRPRFSNLLEEIQNLATNGGVGFRMVQQGQNIEFQVFAPQDRSNEVFLSRELGNLAEYEYTARRPKANYLLVGGGGEGTARTFFELADDAQVAKWGRIEGEFIDQRQTSATDELRQKAVEVMAESNESAGLTVKPIDTDGLMFGRDYDLGDKVLIQMEEASGTPDNDSGAVVEIIREVDIDITPDGVTVTPAIGDSAHQWERLRMWRNFRDLQRRLSNLERR